jgi:adenylosuccinate lyase
VEEPFRAGQKGSSAMPHKRNPITCERLCGLARVLRANLGAGLEDVALWHERDISHSSVERVVLPDSSLLAHYLLVRMRGVVDGMAVHPDRMLENLDRSLGLVFSQPVLLALVASGLPRDTAYRIVQESAATAWAGRRPFRAVLEADPRVTLTGGRLDDAFSLQRALGRAGLVLDALDEVEA